MKTIFTYKNLSRLVLLSAVFSLFGILFPLQALAQHEELLDRTWYLDNLVIESDTIYNPTREDLEYDLASTIYFNSDNDGGIDFGGCPGEYNFIEMEFDDTENLFVTFGIGGFPFQFCSDFWRFIEGLEEFTDLYLYDFFYGYGVEEDGVPIYYTIHDGNNSTQNLVLTNPDGYEAHYNSIFLSTPDFEKLSFSLSPNPVQEQLLIRLAELPSKVSLEVYDIHGKLLKKIAVSEIETHLDVSEYASGMYFIKMSEEAGNTQTGKFVKR